MYSEWQIDALHHSVILIPDSGKVQRFFFHVDYCEAYTKWYV